MGKANDFIVPICAVGKAAILKLKQDPTACFKNSVLKGHGFSRAVPSRIKAGL
jgi:hypothetical protein